MGFPEDNLMESMKHYPGMLHRCFLGDPIHLDWVSPGFCELLGYDEIELYETTQRKYSSMIHPDDRQAFSTYVRTIRKSEGQDSICYRLIAKDGTIIPVFETMTVKWMEDGNPWGFATVTDLSSIVNSRDYNGTTANSSLITPKLRATLNKSWGGSSGVDSEYYKETISRVRFVFEKASRLLDASDSALLVLGVSEDDLAQSRANVLSLIEYSSLRSFEGIAKQCETRYGVTASEQLVPLQRVYIRRLSGEYIEAASLALIEHIDDQKICTLFFVTTPREQQLKNEVATSRFASFLTKAFDVVFSINLQREIVVCAGTKLSEDMRIPVGIPMRFPDAFMFWIDGAIVEEDRAKMREFYSVDNLPSNGEIREISFTCESNGSLFQFDAMQVALPGSILVLYMMKDEDRSIVDERPSSSFAQEHPGVYIRSFGHFDVFLDGEAIPFSSEKSKEYFALLVDRRGGFVSSREAAACLFESDDKSAFARSRKAAMYMNRALQERGIGDIVENQGSSRRLVMSKVRCDLFDYLSADDEEKRRMFNGSYMNDYSWAEVTKAELMFT